MQSNTTGSMLGKLPFGRQHQ